MSTDYRVTKDLVQVLEDAKLGFGQAAEKLAETDRADLAPKFRQFADQRASFSAELEAMAAAYGDDVDEDGSIAGTMHRGWLAVKDAFSGSDPSGVLDAAEQGEDHAVEEYEKALNKDISIDLRDTIQRQFTEVKATHDTVRNLRDSITT